MVLVQVDELSGWLSVCVRVIFTSCTSDSCWGGVGHSQIEQEQIWIKAVCSLGTYCIRTQSTIVCL